MSIQHPKENALLQPPIRSLGFSLDGGDNQSLRRLVERVQIAFVAINGSGVSVLELLLPFTFQSPGIFHGLLAVSTRASQRKTPDFGHYQNALLELSREMELLKTNPETDRVLRILCGSVLLNMYALHQCDESWIQHVRGMINVIRMADQEALRSSTLGLFLMESCAYQDISAFSLGRKQPSQRVWLAWNMRRSAQGGGEGFSPFETTYGYPQTLVNIIALISEAAEDNFNMMIQAQGRYSAISEPSPFHTRENAFLESEMDDNRGLEAALSAWNPPPLPANMAPLVHLALRLARESICRAAFLYLWRAYGFRANLLKLHRADRVGKKDAYVKEILSNIHGVLQIAQTQRISIGNAMLWPLTVAACECGETSTPSVEAEVIEVLESMNRLFSMEHVRHVKELLETIWRRKRALRTQEHIQGTVEPFISLEQVCSELKLVIPLV